MPLTEPFLDPLLQSSGWDRQGVRQLIVVPEFGCQALNKQPLARGKSDLLLAFFFLIHTSQQPFIRPCEDESDGKHFQTRVGLPICHATAAQASAVASSSMSNQIGKDVRSSMRKLYLECDIGPRQVVSKSLHHHAGTNHDRTF